MSLVALANLVLGVAYCGYGVMTAIEMRRDWATFGFSHFGAAWIAMAFTCGPHHLAHGIHLAFEGRAGGPVDLLAVVIGLPVGVWWLYLRVEAFFGGRGDRFVPATPSWLRAAAVAAAVYGVVMTNAIYRIATGDVVGFALSSSGLLVIIYCAIGWFVLRTQLANRERMGGWSVSGLCLSAIFPTCALMHAVFAAYMVGGTYHADIHSSVIDWLSVPAGLYFLAVVRGLYRDAIQDWNAGPDAVETELLDSAPQR
jgi:hypothetical protein